jgi:heme oxygenase
MGLALRTPSSILDHLRARTASLHRELDASLPFGPGLTRGVYARFLRATREVVLDLEPCLPDWGEPTTLRRSDLLAHDLEALVGEVAPSPVLRSVVARPSASGVWGVAYVMEGSSLGGLALAPRVEALLGLARGEGTRYFRFRGASTREAWGRFLVRLDDHDREHGPSVTDAIVDGAEWAFRRYAEAYARMTP